MLHHSILEGVWEHEGLFRSFGLWYVRNAQRHAFVKICLFGVVPVVQLQGALASRWATRLGTIMVNVLDYHGDQCKKYVHCLLRMLYAEEFPWQCMLRFRWELCHQVQPL